MDIQKIVRRDLKGAAAYVPGKPIEELERELGISNIDKLASNENPCGTPETAKKAIMECLDKIYLYPDGESYSFKSVIAEFHKVRYENVFTGNGSDELLQIIMHAFLEPGDNVISSQHSFLRYGQMTRIAHGEYRQAPMTEDMRYDLQAIAGLVDKRTKIIVIANPNNPTGTIVYDKEVRALLDKISDDIIVILDEAYAGFVESKDYPDALKLQKDYPAKPIVMLRSFSKIFGLAGVRVGYGIAPAELVKYINVVRGPFNINMLAQAAGIACLKNASQHAKSSKELCSGEKKYLYESYKKLGVKYFESEANFILVKIDDRHDGKYVVEELLKAGIIVRPMKSWGLTDNFMRITIGTQDQNKRLIKELTRLLNKDSKAAADVK
ncbi:MAG TPA: histidinol-phosphate transaminase [Candidatus Wallbacteria bacterium]|nr:histidinol-phosphate transaminase [Candidatus Wallbacteria bacterium]